MMKLDELYKVEIKDLKDDLSADTLSVELTEPHEQTAERVALTKTPCNYGGIRYWFKCRNCNSKTPILYYHCDMFKCRSCTGLQYRTQTLQPLDRMINRVEAIRSKLGWKAGIANGHGTKPRGLWNKTYNRLVQEHDELAMNIIKEMKGVCK